MNNPKFFIVSSAYNSEKTLNSFFDSLEDQIYANWILLIADDLSTDETRNIIEERSFSNKKIKLFKNKENLGLTKSLNKLINNVPNEAIIVRMDTDEFYNKGFLQEIVYLINDRKYDLILSTSNIKYSLILNNLSTNLSLIFLTLWGNIFHHGSAIFSKELFVKCGGYKKHMYFSQDYILWIRMIYFAKRKYFIYETKFKQIKNDQRISIINRIEQVLFSFFGLIEFLDLFFGRKNQFLYKFFLYFLLLISILVRFLRYLFIRLI